MSSLAEIPELVGFFSYSRKDDEHSAGALSRLRLRIHSELRLQLGRDFRLWQDTAAIPEGALWEDEIKRSIGEAVFFIPIVTPSAVGSEHCRFEFESFLAREAALGRHDLVFPILYIRVPALEREQLWRQDELLRIIGTRQYADWQRYRHLDVTTPPVAEKVEHFCNNIAEALRQAWVSPEERRRREEIEGARLREADAKRRAEEEEKRKKTEAEERRRNEEAEATRLREIGEGRRSEQEQERNEARAEESRREHVAVSVVQAVPAAAERKAANVAARPGHPRWRVGAAIGVAALPLGTILFAYVNSVEMEAKHKAEVEAARKAGAEEALHRVEDARKAAAEDARRKTEEARKAAEEEARRKADEERKRAEEAARRDPALAITPGSGQSFRDRLANGPPCPTCPELVVVPAGSFTMGSPASEPGHFADEGPQHQVNLSKPFAVGRFAVTFDEWDACVADGGCSRRPGDQGWGRGRLPAINVWWSDAKSYAEWLSRKTGKTYRLLSEAEREYVTRAGTSTPYWWGSDISKSQANYQASKPMPVDSFAPNAWGLYQVHGNVWEWTEDCWNSNYGGAPADGSAWTAGDCNRRVVRGGSWDYFPPVLRSASRSGLATGNRYYNLGFRVGRTLTP
jgi:formylglycine-generating enzyme required for sulfatase activity